MNDKIAVYTRMTVVISIFCGTLELVTYSNLFYLKEDLKKNAAEFTDFDFLTRAAWILKPVFACVSDSFFPFRYR